MEQCHVYVEKFLKTSARKLVFVGLDGSKWFTVSQIF